MRRTGFLFLLFLFGIGTLLAQTDPQITALGLSNTSGGGASSQAIQAEETVYVTVTGNGSGGTLQGNIHWDGANVNNQLYLYYYTDAPPATFKTYKTVTASNFTVNSNTVTFQFTMPAEDSNTSGSTSIQCYFGLVGVVPPPPIPVTNLGTANASYTVNNAPAGYYSYMTYTTDVTTKPPTLTAPAHGSRENQSIYVDFTLQEDATPGTVKLYIDNDTNTGNGVVSTLTLNSNYETAGTYDLYLNGADLDDSTDPPGQSGDGDDVASITGSNSLVNGTTYYWTIGYQDVGGNPENTDGPNSMVYDTSALAVTGIAGIDNSNGTVDVDYTLGENASELWVIFYDNSLSVTRARLEIDPTYASSYLTGSVNLETLDATNFNNCIGTGKLLSIDGNYSASLVDEHVYQVKVEYTDLAGNERTSTGAGTFTYTNDTTTATPTTPSASEAYNSTDDAPALTVGYYLPEAGYTNSVRVLIDNDTSHPAVGVTDATGLFAMLEITNEDDTGSHSFVLSVPFVGTDGGGDGDQVTTVHGTAALVNGATYYYAMEYQDAAGNAAARTTWVSFTWDGATAAFAQFTAPIDDTYFKSGDTIPVTYQLGETGRDGEMAINIYGGPAGDSSDLYTTAYIASGQSLNNTSPHTISLSPANLASATQISSASPYNSLPDNANAPYQYWFEVVYRDAYGNSEVATAAKRNAYYDDTTIAATLTTPVAGGSTTTVNIAFDYTLGEAMSTVYIDFIGQGNVPLARNDVAHKRVQNVSVRNNIESETLSRDATTHTIQLTGAYLNSGQHTFTLDGTDIGDVGDADITLLTGENFLTDEEVYDVRIRVADVSGNSEQSTTNADYTYMDDATTDTPSISAPSLNSYQNGSISFTFNLSEPGTAGTVQILFDDDATHTTVYETLTFTGENGAGSHTVTLENMGSNIAGNAEVNASTPHNALADNSGQPAQYYVAVRYQDDQGNPAATSAWHTFYFDNETLAPTLDLPTDDQTITGNFDVQYDLPETALAGNSGLYLQFTCTSTTETDRKFAIASHASGTNISISNIDPTAIGDHASLTLFAGSTALTIGETYTVSIHTKDLANNAEQSDASTGFQYNTAASILTVANIALNNEPLGGASATDQQIIRFSLTGSAGSSISLSDIDFVVSGSAATADFVAGSFELWADSNNDGTPDGAALASDGFGTTLEFSGMSETITDSPSYYIVICDLSAAAVESHTIRLTLNSTGMTSDATSYNGFPIQGLVHYLDGYIVELAGGGTGVTGISPGEEDSILWWYLTTNQGEEAYSSVTVALTTNDWADIDAVHLYSNSVNSLVGATLLDSDTSPSGTSATFDPGVNVTTTRTYFIVTAEVSPGANMSHTVQAEVTDATDMTFGGTMNIPAALASSEFPITGLVTTLPVELSSYDISNSGRTVTLEWVTETETENAGFNLYRGLSPDAFVKGQTIKVNPTLIPGANTSATPTDYVYTDETRVEYETTYYYWLETVNLSGTSGTFAPWAYTPMASSTGNVPDYIAYGLQQNYPNPFNPTTTISFTMKNDGPVSVDVYNIKGQHVRNVFDGNASADQTVRVMWDGRDTSGKGVGSGIYFYRLRQGSLVQTKQMIMMQ